MTPELTLVERPSRNWRLPRPIRRLLCIMPLAFAVACGGTSNNCTYRAVDSGGRPYGEEMVDNDDATWQDNGAGGRYISDCGPTDPGFVQTGGPQ